MNAQNPRETLSCIKMNPMIKISYWAKENIRMARSIIVGSFLLMTMLALFTGWSVAGLGIELPEWLFYAAVASFCWVFMDYPFRVSSQHGQHRRRSFFKRKAYDMIAATTGYLMLVQVANHYSFYEDSAFRMFGGSATYGMETFPVIHGGEKGQSKIEGKAAGWLKDKKARIKTHLALLRKLDKKKDSAKAALAFLAIVGGVALLILIALLSCEISCSGSETLGMIVLIGGSALVILGVTMIILRIYKGKRSKSSKNRQNVPVSSD